MARQTRRFTEEARAAALVARKAKQARPDTFGLPELFVVKVGDQTFTWDCVGSEAWCSSAALHRSSAKPWHGPKGASDVCFVSMSRPKLPFRSPPKSSVRAAASRTADG